MKLSLVLIVYRSDSSIAEEASKFCEEVLKSKNINSKRIESDFYKDDIEKYFCNFVKEPDNRNVEYITTPEKDYKFLYEKLITPRKN